MYSFPKPVEDAIEAFASLPGVGRKSAQRLVQHLLKESDMKVARFSDAVGELKASVGFCRQCFHITEKEQEKCVICNDEARDPRVICIVEDFIDVFAFENTKLFKGVYHVLHGVLSPVNGVGPDKLTMAALAERLKHAEIQELIIATNPTMEGEATALYIRNNLPIAEDVTVSRIAKGMPMGGNIDYADEVTLGNALERRSSM